MIFVCHQYDRPQISCFYVKHFLKYVNKIFVNMDCVTSNIYSNFSALHTFSSLPNTISQMKGGIRDFIINFTLPNQRT